MKNIFKHAIYAVLIAAGSAHADDVYTITNGTFAFYDASGLENVSAGHMNVFADGVTATPSSGSGAGEVNYNVMSQPINFTTGTGRLITTTGFQGYYWIADVAAIKKYDGATGGGAQNFTYTWVTNTYGITGVGVVECRISGSIDNCTDEVAAGGTFLGTTSNSYTYTLSEGQFALEMFFDWSSNADIPVLAVFNISSIAANGDIVTASVDSDTNGWPGHAMSTNPFPGQTPVFSGSFVPSSNDAVITAQAPLTTNEEVQIALAKTDFTISTSVFPTGVYLNSSKSLYIGSGTGYTTNGTSTVTPSLNRDTALTVPIGIKVSNNNSATFNATVNINAINDAPSISCAYSASAPVNTLYGSTPVSSDPDTGASLAFSFTSDLTATVAANTLPDGLSFSTSTGAITGTPTTQNQQSTNIVVSVSDGIAASVSCSAFALTVTGPNTAPTMITGTPTASVNEDSAYSFNVDCTDPDIGDSITAYELTGAPAWMSINSSTGVISGTPIDANVGVATGITALCRDTANATASVAFSVTVNNTNDAPVIGVGSCATGSIEAGAAFTCTPTASDDDLDSGDSLTFSATGLPASLSISTSTGQITGTTTSSDVGIHNITVTVTDADGPLADSFPITLTVTAYNAAPVASDTSLSTPVDTVLTGSLAGLVTDPENCGCITFRNKTISAATAFGTVVIAANGDFTYTPNAGYNGRDSFTYIATDELRDSNDGVVQILIGTVSGENYSGSNFTMLNSLGNNADGGANDVIASWDGLLNTDESDTNFSHMTLSSITKYFGALWEAHHIRVYGPGTYTFDTTCTVAQLEAGISNCNNPLQTSPAPQTERYITMTVGAGQIGAHILFNWSGNDNIDVVNVWNVDSQFDVSLNPGTGVLWTAGGYGSYPWSGAPATNTSWRLASSDNDGDGIPGVPMVDGAFIGFNANFNLFVGSGIACVPSPGNLCVVIDEGVIPDPDVGAGSAFSLVAIYLMWLGIKIGFGRTRKRQIEI